MRSRKAWGERHKESGATLYIVAAGMVFLLAACGLAIDLGSLYVGRSEAQRAADAAALAGATLFVTSSCTGTGPNACLSGTIEAAAKAAAKATGNNNLVGGQSPNIQDADISFIDSTPNGTNPRITVNVHQSMPTFFMKIFGVQSGTVAATATAEAYNASGGNTPVSLTCVKPWLLPNCDPNTTHGGPTNPNCGGAPVFIDSSGNVVNNRPVSSNGIIGEYLTVKPGDPQSSPQPGWYYPIQLSVNTPNDLLCPGCAGNTIAGSTGASVYSENICCCNTSQVIRCGSDGTVDINLAYSAKTGNMQGPTQQGATCLINELTQGSNKGTGQDTLCGPTILTGDAPCSPLWINGGPNNPNPVLQNRPLESNPSPSVVAVPLYDGHIVSNNTTIQIVGFLQLFIDSVELSNASGNKGNVNATIMAAVACPTGGGGGSSGTVSGGGSAIPVRLVQP